ncbi:hypothetical protein R3P38DRAFT_2543392, partial [Favolaschia claudopus]
FEPTASSVSTVSKLAIDALLTPHPRCSGPLGRSPIRPTPTPIGGEGSPSRGVRSIHNRQVADARKASDIVLMEFIQQIDASGLLKADPSIHPAWDMNNNPPSILHVYDRRIYSFTLDQTYAHVEFLYKKLGQLVREMNSVLGIPFRDHATLIRSSRSCVGCLNQFSPHGYEDHRREGHCTNHPDCIEVEACKTIDSLIQFRSFRGDARPEFKGETPDTPVGAALIQWNSRLGVPADVWMLISTAVVHCTSCDLTRTFPAHTLHLDVTGQCADPGQAIIAPGGDDD